MSSPKSSDIEENEKSLKGGHPPAVKAGGMRITQHKLAKSERETKSEDSKVATSPPKTITISGAIVKGNAEFTTESVKHYHEKPMPTHENRSCHTTQNMPIQQPRK